MLNSHFNNNHTLSALNYFHNPKVPRTITHKVVVFKALFNHVPIEKVARCHQADTNPANGKLIPSPLTEITALRLSKYSCDLHIYTIGR
jgi:hypothetical protein